MSKEKLTFKESVELFLQRTITDLHSNEEIPALNLIFHDDAFKLFEYIKKHPTTKEGYLIPAIKEHDILKATVMHNNNPYNPVIEIKNATLFFELLQSITNAWLEQKNKYWGSTSARSTFISDIKRLFLRMSPKDLDNIEEFLQLQLDFLKSNILDEYIKKNVKVGEFSGYNLYSSKEENASWCETSDKMTFYLKGENDDFHTLPSIYFGTRLEEGEIVCYIYAIQNERHRRIDKKIQRKLYKLNSGIENPDVNPASILSLKTFIGILKSHGITKIKVPRLQVLSYRYHELLSEHTKQDFQRRYSEERLEYINNLLPYERDRELEEYEWQKTWYSRVVDKQDFIHETKTTGLLKIFKRVLSQYSNLEIVNLDNCEDTTDFRIIEPSKKLTK